MSKSNVKANKSSFRELIIDKQKNYIIPKFQRTYCWKEANIESLLQDVCSSGERKFLGALILQETSRNVGSEYSSYEVIDGQQRISTLFWIVSVLSNKCIEICKHYIDILDESTEQDLIKKIEGKAAKAALINKNLFSQEIDSYKTKLHCNLVDLKEFNESIAQYCVPVFNEYGYGTINNRADGPEENRGGLKSAIKIIDQKIEDKFDKRGLGYPVDEDEENNELELEEKKEKFEEIIDCYLGWLDQLSDNLDFVEIILDEDHDSNEVFTKLNTLGESLNAQDIIRNEIFSLFENEPAEETHFYKNHWLEFERSLYEDIPNLDNKEDAQRDKAIGEHCQKFWHPYALTIDPNTRADDSVILRVLKRYWEPTMKDGALSPTEKALKILEQVKKYVPIYNCIVLGSIPQFYQGSGKKKKKLREEIEKLHRYKPTSGVYFYLFNLLLYGIENKLKDDQLNSITQCLIKIESYFIRRNLYKDDGSVKNVFSNIWDNSSKKPDSKKLAQGLNDINRPWYTDNEIMERSDRNFYSGKTADYILATYEQDLGGDALQNPQKEHVMPRNYNSSWNHFTEEEHAEYLNMWGNIVHISGKLNKKFSDKGYEDKKKEILDPIKHYKSSSARELFQADLWTKNEILERNEKLYKWALKKWKRDNNLPSPGSMVGSQRKLNAISKKFEKNNINSCLFVYDGNLGRSKRIGLTDDLAQFFKENLKIDIYSMNKGSNKVIKVYRFTQYDDPEEEDLTLYLDSQGSPKFYPEKQSEQANHTIMSLCVDSQSKLYLVNCSVEQNLTTAVSYLKDL